MVVRKTFTEHVREHPLVRRLYLRRVDENSDFGEWSPAERQNLMDFSIVEVCEQIVAELVEDWNFAMTAADWWLGDAESKSRYDIAYKKAQFWKNRWPSVINNVGTRMGQWLPVEWVVLEGEEWKSVEIPRPPTSSQLAGMVRGRNQEWEATLARTFWFYAGLPAGPDRDELNIKPYGFKLLTILDTYSQECNRLRAKWAELF